MVMPGDNVTITVELIYPVALNVGLRFAIREGGRTVGAGQITEILGLGEDKKSVVTGVEMFRKLLDQGEAGDNVGLLRC